MLSRGGLDEPLANGRRDASEALTPEETERIDNFDPRSSPCGRRSVWASRRDSWWCHTPPRCCARTAPPSASPQRGCPSSPRSPPWDACWRVGVRSTAHRRRDGARGAPALAAPALAWAAAAEPASSRRRRRSRRRRSRTECSPAPFLWRFDDALDVEIFRARTVSCVHGVGVGGALRRPRRRGALRARGSYTAALTVATALSLGSAVVAATLRPGRPSHAARAAAIASRRRRGKARGRGRRREDVVARRRSDERIECPNPSRRPAA